MKARCTAFVFCFLCMVFSCVANAKSLQLLDIYRSIDDHFPKIKASLAGIEEERGNLQSAKGAFDARVDGQLSDRASGYYDGGTFQSQLVKPVPAYNAELYTGYRYSDGDFPIYEAKDVTRDRGEYNVGVVFSLLRDRDIDKDRFAVADADYNLQVAMLENLITMLEVKLKAQNAYTEWQAAQKILGTYQELLNLALQRQRNLEKQVAAGDMAKIALVENKQNILKREVLLNEAKRDYIVRSNALSLYMRDDTGQIVKLENRYTAPDMIVDNDPEKYEDSYISNVVTSRPELRVLEKRLLQQNNKLLLGENSLLPKVDLSIEAAQDMGQGPSTLSGTEAIGKIKFSIPLQRELGKGAVYAAKSKITKLKNDKLLLEDKIKIELMNMLADLKTLKKNIDLSAQELTLAVKMQQAETDLLNHGSSNLFLLNTREEKVVEAKVKNTLSKMYYLKAKGTFEAATIQLDKFNIPEQQAKIN